MSGHPAEEVKIRLKHGEWEVEVVCIESRVKQVVESVLSSLDTAKIMGPGSSEPARCIEARNRLLKG